MNNSACLNCSSLQQRALFINELIANQNKLVGDLLAEKKLADSSRVKAVELQRQNEYLRKECDDVSTEYRKSLEISDPLKEENAQLRMQLEATKQELQHCNADREFLKLRNSQCDEETVRELSAETKALESRISELENRNKKHHRLMKDASAVVHVLVKMKNSLPQNEAFDGVLKCVAQLEKILKYRKPSIASIMEAEICLDGGVKPQEQDKIAVPKGVNAVVECKDAQSQTFVAQSANVEIQTPRIEISHISVQVESEQNIPQVELESEAQRADKCTQTVGDKQPVMVDIFTDTNDIILSAGDLEQLSTSASTSSHLRQNVHESRGSQYEILETTATVTGSALRESDHERESEKDLNEQTKTLNKVLVTESTQTDISGEVKLCVITQEVATSPLSEELEEDTCMTDAVSACDKVDHDQLAYSESYVPLNVENSDANEKPSSIMKVPVDLSPPGILSSLVERVSPFDEDAEEDVDFSNLEGKLIPICKTQKEKKKVTFEDLPADSDSDDSDTRLLREVQSICSEMNFISHCRLNPLSPMPPSPVPVASRAAVLLKPVADVPEKSTDAKDKQKSKKSKKSKSHRSGKERDGKTDSASDVVPSRRLHHQNSTGFEPRLSPINPTPNPSRETSPFTPCETPQATNRPGKLLAEVCHAPETGCMTLNLKLPTAVGARVFIDLDQTTGEVKLSCADGRSSSLAQSPHMFSPSTSSTCTPLQRHEEITSRRSSLGFRAASDSASPDRCSKRRQTSHSGAYEAIAISSPKSAHTQSGSSRKRGATSPRREASSPSTDSVDYPSAFHRCGSGNEQNSQLPIAGERHQDRIPSPNMVVASPVSLSPTSSQPNTDIDTSQKKTDEAVKTASKPGPAKIAKNTFMCLGDKRLKKMGKKDTTRETKVSPLPDMKKTIEDAKQKMLDRKPQSSAADQPQVPKRRGPKPRLQSADSSSNILPSKGNQTLSEGLNSPTNKVSLVGYTPSDLSDCRDFSDTESVTRDIDDINEDTVDSVLGADIMAPSPIPLEDLRKKNVDQTPQTSETGAVSQKDEVAPQKDQVASQKEGEVPTVIDCSGYTDRSWLLRKWDGTIVAPTEGELAQEESDSEDLQIDCEDMEGPASPDHTDYRDLTQIKVIPTDDFDPSLANKIYTDCRRQSKLRIDYQSSMADEFREPESPAVQAPCHISPGSSNVLSEPIVIRRSPRLQPSDVSKATQSVRPKINLLKSSYVAEKEDDYDNTALIGYDDTIINGPSTKVEETREKTLPVISVREFDLLQTIHMKYFKKPKKTPHMEAILNRVAIDMSFMSEACSQLGNQEDLPKFFVTLILLYVDSKDYLTGNMPPQFNQQAKHILLFISDFLPFAQKFKDTKDGDPKINTMKLCVSFIRAFLMSVIARQRPMTELSPIYKLMAAMCERLNKPGDIMDELVYCITDRPHDCAYAIASVLAGWPSVLAKVDADSPCGWLFRYLLFTAPSSVEIEALQTARTVCIYTGLKPNTAHTSLREAVEHYGPLYLVKRDEELSKLGIQSLELMICMLRDAEFSHLTVERFVPEGLAQTLTEKERLMLIQACGKLWQTLAEQKLQAICFTKTVGSISSVLINCKSNAVIDSASRALWSYLKYDTCSSLAAKIRTDHPNLAEISDQKWKMRKTGKAQTSGTQTVKTRSKSKKKKGKRNARGKKTST